MIEDIAKLGIVAADSPEALGGKGMSRVDVGSLMYELAVKDGSIATFWLLHDSLSTYTVMCFAQDDLRKKILADTIPLKKVMAWALTEPDTGSDASHIQTTARKVEGGYLINGHKKWIGNATFADYILVWAKNQNDGGKVQCFLVRKGSKDSLQARLKEKWHYEQFKMHTSSSSTSLSLTMRSSRRLMISGIQLKFCNILESPLLGWLLAWLPGPAKPR